MRDDIERRFRRAREGRIDTVGTVSLALAPAIITIVTHPACSSTSHVSLSPANAAARSDGLPQVTPGTGVFTLTHTPNAVARIYSYAIFTPAVA